MSNPKIDKRAAGDIEKNIKDLIPAYLPNWKLEPGEPGWAIAQVFSKMVEEILKRLNQVPERLFITYLDKLGIKISPPLPARAPITFYLAEGVNENVKVPAKVSIATKEQVNFETEKEFTATTAKLSALLSIDPDQDNVFDHSKQIQQSSPIVLFPEKQNEGQHILYIGDNYLFNLNRGVGKNLYIKLTVPFIENCTWQYWGEDEDGNEDWREFGIEPEGEKTQLYKQLPPPTSKKNINGHNTYWIRAVFKGACCKEIKISYFNIDYESKSGVDALFYNDVPIDVNILNKENQFFYPFGPEPKLQDTFYIASNEALSKRGLNIKLKFFVKETDTKGKIEEEPVFSWEYWDGKGWKSLSYKVNEWYIDYNSKKNFFPITLTFACPDDIEKTEVNGEKNYWIRVRLIGGGYGKYYIEGRNLKKKFNPPQISSVSFCVNGTNVKYKHIFTYNNLSWDEPSAWPTIIFYPLSDKHSCLPVLACQGVDMRWRLCSRG